MIRLAILGLIVGAVLGYMTYVEGTLAFQSSADAETISLKDLIARGPDGNAHVVVSGFVLCENYVFESDGRRKNVWTDVWMPIVPQEEVGRAAQGQLKPSKVRALFFSTQIRHPAELETRLNKPFVQGLVTNRITRLKGETRRLLQQNYADTDFDTCLIIQEGRTPYGRGMVFLFGAGAVASFGAALGCWLISRRRARTPIVSTPAAARKMPAETHVEIPCTCGATMRSSKERAGSWVACPTCGAKHTVLVPQGEPAVLGQFVTPPPQKVPPAAPPKGISYYFRGANLEDADFFVPAPQEIGAVRSAHTSMLKKNKHKPLGWRLGIGLFIGLGIPALLALTFLALDVPSQICMLVFLVGAAFLTPISLLLTLYLTRFRYYCAYVGERGIAQFFCSGSRSRITTKILEFTDDLNLHVKTRTIHVPELGGESTYHFRWTDPAGRKVFDVSGNLVSWPPVQSRYHLGTEAEQSWSRYLVAKVLPAIRDGQPYTFKLKARDGICCAKDALELIRKGRVLQLRPEELSQVTMQDGKIFLQEPGASVGWLSSTGVHYISSANLANARAFLLLVEELYGVTPKMRMGKR